MPPQIVSLLIIINLGNEIVSVMAQTNCPIICTCRLEHLTETAIYRFMQNHKQDTTEMGSIEFNDVLYELNFEAELLEDRPIVRSAICILQTETQPVELIDDLPSDIESLTIIQGSDTGNKTLNFSHLNRFKQLISLELLGPNQLNHQHAKSRFLSEIDTPLVQIKYLNLENVLIKNSKTQIQNFVRTIQDNIDELTFEYVQKFDYKTHPLTMVQKGTNEDVLPYTKYKEQDNPNKVPLFIGFKNLHLLRITNCELNNVHWEMFDGLQNLVYLILNKNNLKFIPPFAFYGTPNLRTLSLAHNNLLDIQITDLAGLLELEYLDLSFNNFSQLSELSLPPFPKLKLANFANNPITVIFPNTFEVMNTTDSMVIGSDDVPLSLMTNSFLGLNLLKTLTLNNLNIKLLKRDLFIGMPLLNELILTGNITTIEYDTFSEMYKLRKLTLAECKVQNVSMDSFIGLNDLEYLDLSKNKLEYLPPGIFDQLRSLKELYLNGNRFTKLPRDIFTKIHAKLIRLNDNPWHCSCDMSEWKPMLVNKIKQKTIKNCDVTHDKGVGCVGNRFTFKYVYENKVAPKCAQPVLYLNWSVFHVMRRLLKCPEYKPKLKKHIRITSNHANIGGEKRNSAIPESVVNLKMSKINLKKHAIENNLIQTKQIENKLDMINDNDLNVLHPIGTYKQNHVAKPEKKYNKSKRIRKYKKQINLTI